MCNSAYFSFILVKELFPWNLVGYVLATGLFSEPSGFFFFRYPATLCWRLDLPVLWKPLSIFILWLRLIGRTWLFIYLHGCKLGPSHTQKNHLLCTYIAFCRQINIVLTGDKKLNPNSNSDSEFWMIQLLCNLSGFFFFFLI